jgi:hypothetical protein
MEEFEAIDWYNQRVDACKDDELKAILAHNRDEEKEHAAMVLEWIRRKDSTLDKELKNYLFTEKSIAHKLATPDKVIPPGWRGKARRPLTATFLLSSPIPSWQFNALTRCPDSVDHIIHQYRGAGPP